MIKSIAIFGATGSIGKNAIEVVLNAPDSYKIVALTANSDVKNLIKQARQVKPSFAVIGNDQLFLELKEALSDLPEIIVLSGENSINEIAKIKCDLFISAIVGMAALMPTINAIRAGSNIGLANKECLVSAGDLILNEAEKSGSKLIPIDSEHNAIFQIFENEHLDLIEDITLTASGGPFYKLSNDQLKNVTIDQAISHPNWSMGAKISVDSATLMNKGLELIEAHYLFGTAPSQLDAVIHPQSIIHALIELNDGSMMAHMSEPDMRSPIAYALSYPERIATPVKKLNLAAIGNLTFEAPDDARFPALRLAKQALATGGNAPTVLNAANEIAVARFLRGDIGFLDIATIVEKALANTQSSVPSTLDELFSLDSDVRRFAEAA